MSRKSDVPAALWVALRTSWKGRTLFIAAGISYFGVFSLVPGLLTVAAVAGLVWGDAAASGELMSALGRWAGPEPARFLSEALAHARPPWSAGVVAGGAVLFAASLVFYHLRRALEVLWGVGRHHGVRHAVVGRLAAFVMVFVAGALMAAALGVHAALGAARHFWGDLLPAAHVAALWTLLDDGVLFMALGTLITAVFKWLPRDSPPWRETIAGGVVTAGLLSVANRLLGAYFVRAPWRGIYGAGAGLIVILLWVYLSAEVFLFGAAFTKALALRRGWDGPDEKENDDGETESL